MTPAEKKKFPKKKAAKGGADWLGRAHDEVKSDQSRLDERVGKQGGEPRKNKNKGGEGFPFTPKGGVWGLAQAGKGIVSGGGLGGHVGGVRLEPGRTHYRKNRKGEHRISKRPHGLGC